MTARMTGDRVVLCFGDSLTAGYIITSPHTGEYHPYRDRLQASLRRGRRGDGDGGDDGVGDGVNVIAVGASGVTAQELATPGNLDGTENVDVCRKVYAGLRASLRDITRRGDTCIGVIIMGGTNDLADRGATATEVFTSILALHRVCYDFGIPTISLSVPPNANGGSAAPHCEGASGNASAAMKEYVETWQQVNKSLKAEFGRRNNASEDRNSISISKDDAEAVRAHSMNSCGDVLPRTAFFDVERCVPYFPESRYWEQDGLHMTAAGYDRLGETLAPLVKETFF